MRKGDARSAAPALHAWSAESWRQLEDVLDAALDAPPGEREALVNSRCGDVALREAALAWLRACEHDDGALDAPPGADTLLDAVRGAAEIDSGPDAPGTTADGVRPRAARPSGTRVGPWRLLGELGRGGMGTVYLAERADAELPMRAALKFMHSGTAFDAVGVRRFRDERRILASLAHPSIARLLDGGIDDGLPWFAMEYVAGAPIDVWCDARALPVEERLRLFCRVCDAVQHAHARLVVHRDLKPANILVSDEGDPKLLDFGVAKLLATGDPSDPALTRPGAQPMTVGYAAPEQLRGDEPSTATDVYALGVLLYVLLTGQPPVGVRRDDAGIVRPSAAVLRTRRDDGDPDVAALSMGTAAARATNPARLARRLRGDLDTIVARAMHAEPARRYPTADALAADLRRHLEGRPVLARPDTLTYRLRKLVARHPVGSAAAALGTTLILAFAAVTAAQASRLRTQAASLIAERDKATEVTAFLAGLLASADPYQPGGRAPTLREVLDRWAERAAASLRDRPEVRAHLLSAMAPAYFGLGDWNRAGELAEEAVTIRRRIFGPSHPELAAALVYLANVRLNQGRAAEAESQAREALAIRGRLPQATNLDTARILSTLGAALQRQGKLSEAEAVLRTLLASERRRHPANPGHVAQVARNLAHVLRDQRRYADAVPLYAEAYALHRGIFGDEHPETANSAVNLGNAHFRAGNAAAGEPLLRRGVETKRRLLGIEHRDVAGDQLTLAHALAARGAHEEADALRREAEAVLARLAVSP